MSSDKSDIAPQSAKIDPVPLEKEHDMQASDIETEMQKLRSDIAALAKTVAAVGADTAGAYRAKAGEVASDAIEASKGVLECARKDFELLEKDVVTRIRTRPLLALGLAAAVGFLLAHASSRR
ncbi:MAG: hypothetical protein P4M00_11170 [Azospirillaceae bacterium]|nr:hypothetical protein [Azospirillaceae bacterium]